MRFAFSADSGGSRRAAVRSLVVIVVAALAAAPSRAGTAAPAPSLGNAIEDARKDPALARVLEAFDAAQRATTTLVARFTEEKRLKLLARPVVSRGELFFNRPNQVRWEYVEPDRKVFVITEERYMAYYPALKRAEEVPIKKFVGRRLFRFMGLGQSLDELGKSYAFRLEPKSDVVGTHLLVLTPRKRRMRERMIEMRIWVDAGNALPRRLQYLEVDGDSTILEFDDLRPNVDIAANRFRIDLPKDVIVSETFNGFSLGEQSF